MNVNRSFLIGFYLTLGLAVACLTHAEAVFLPGIYWLALPVGALLILAFLLEGRWHLSITLSHCLGLLLATGSALWIAYHMLRPSSNVIDSAPWPVAILPYLGPILMMLSLAKLFRPKEVADYWLLFAIGLMQVTLACVLSYEAAFGFFLFAYVAASLWSLGEFYLAREVASCAVVAVLDEAGRPRRASSPGVVSMAWLALRVVTLAILAFLVTPHLADSHWDPITLSRTAVLTSGGAGETVDLNRVGTVRLSPRVAFEVEVESEGNEAADLTGQRFRGVALVRYQQGKWSQPDEAGAWLGSGARVPGSELEPPLARPGTFWLTLHVDVAQTRGLVIAEPSATSAGDPLPIECLEPAALPTALFRQGQGGLVATLPVRSGRYVYRQRTARATARPRSADFDERELHRDPYLKHFVPRVRYATARMLRHLARTGVIDFSDFQTTRDDFQIVVPRDRHRRVAVALEEHLANSKEYSYSLRLRRANSDLDPCEDFLLNVKAGHCELFATALALQLRACGIPSRLVRGYVGADSDPAAPGRFLVRQSMAHAWVEALFDSESEDGKVYWQTLDPTPSLASFDATDLPWYLSLLYAGAAQGEGLWRNYLVEYTADQRDECARAAWNWMTTWWKNRSDELPPASPSADAPRRLLDPSATMLAIAVFVLLALAAAWWFGKRTRDTSPDALGFHARWLTWLAREFGLRPAPEQTPREFAQQLRNDLHESESDQATPAAGKMLAEVAALADHVVELHYRERYGARPATREELAAMDQRQQAIEAARHAQRTDRRGFFRGGRKE